MEEIPSTRKRGAKKIYEEKQTYYNDKQLFRCKRGCPKAFFCQNKKMGLLHTSSLVNININNQNYFLPKKAVEFVDVCFDKNQNKTSEILNQIRDQLAPQLSKKQLNN